VVGVLVLRPDLGVPLLPIHLLWVNLLTDGAPAVALGVDPVDDGVLRRPPRSHTQRLLDRDHWLRLLARGATLASGPLLAATVVARQLDLGTSATRTLSLTVLVVAHLLYALVLGRFRWRTVVPLAVAGGLALHLAAVLLPAGRDLLGLHALPPVTWPWCWCWAVSRSSPSTCSPAAGPASDRAATGPGGRARDPGAGSRGRRQQPSTVSQGRRSLRCRALGRGRRAASHG
jgi:magnesium-transporting ATPase (P-type)